MHQLDKYKDLIVAKMHGTAVKIEKKYPFVLERQISYGCLGE